MGKLLQGILGGVSGKVGNVIGSSWKGIPVIKAKALSVANPRTAGQVAQRGRLSNVVAFSKPLLSTIIKPLWDRFAQQESGYNAFVSENIALFDNALPSPAADLVISSGKMAPTSILAVTANDGVANVEVNWLDDSGTGLKLATDLAYVVIVNETTEEVAVSSGSVDRDSPPAVIELPSAVSTGDEIRAYMAFKRADGTVVSDTSTDVVTV